MRKQKEERRKQKSEGIKEKGQGRKKKGERSFSISYFSKAPYRGNINFGQLKKLRTGDR